MFNPSTADVRRFFCDTWRKSQAGELLSPLEDLAAGWISAHPEYHALLNDVAAALAVDFSPARGESNPFMHLSMHLAIDEQLQIDQPAGIRELFDALARRHGDRHTAAHETMECLGRVVWEAQRGALPADPGAINATYLDCLRRRLG